MVPQQPQEANPPASALEAQPGPQVCWCPGAEQEAASTMWEPWPQAPVDPPKILCKQI